MNKFEKEGWFLERKAKVQTGTIDFRHSNHNELITSVRCKWEARGKYTNSW